MQIADKEVVSQLGLGKHWQMLRAINAGLNISNGLFQTDFFHLKEAVWEDLMGKDVRYWQPEEKILAELNKIIGNQFMCLTAADREALELRLAMFQNPAAHGLRVNIRAGE